MGAVFAIFASFYYWAPAIFKRTYNETLAKLHFVLLFAGANLTFGPMHFLGLAGMPRRIPEYPNVFSGWNTIATFGTMLSTLATLLFVYIVFDMFWSQDRHYQPRVPRMEPFLSGLRGGQRHLHTTTHPTYANTLYKHTQGLGTYYTHIGCLLFTIGERARFATIVRQRASNSLKARAPKEGRTSAHLFMSITLAMETSQFHSATLNQANVLSQPLPDFYAQPWQLGFSTPASAAMLGIVDLHHEIMFSLIVIAFTVTACLVALLRSSSKASLVGFQEPTKPSANTNTSAPSLGARSAFNASVSNLTHCLPLEMGWTILPALILLTILIPSLSLVYRLDDLITPAVTVKVIGKQWYWVYEYSDYANPSTKYNNSLSFESRLLLEETNSFRSTAPLNLLRVDRAAVVPTHVNLRFLVTSADVIHSFAVPSLGVKIDAMPGRLNQVLTNISLEGNHWGQCSELCGMGHGFMPIQLLAVETSKFFSWIVLCYLEQQLDNGGYPKPYSTDGVIEWLYLLANIKYTEDAAMPPTPWLIFWQDQLQAHGPNTCEFLGQYKSYLETV